MSLTLSLRLAAIGRVWVGRAAIRGGARGVLGVAWRWFGRILRRLMDSSTVTKPLDISAFDTASLKERLGGLRRYL